MRRLRNTLLVIIYNSRSIQLQLRILAIILLGLGLLLTSASDTAAAAAEKSRGYAEPAESKLFRKTESYTPIQSLVDAVPPGGELVLPEGQYAGPLIIDKPISITGLADETTLHISDDEQTISLQSDNITIRNLTVMDGRKEAQAAAISAEGHRAVALEDVNIQTSATAIEWRSMRQSKITGSTVRWSGQSYAKRSSRGNGIYLYGSSDIMLEQNTISSVYDGIYAENSERLKLRGNKVSESRYAYHMMYTEQVELFENESDNNVTGLMVMTSSEVKLHNNKLSQHQGNANAAAVLIYDVVGGEVYNNYIAQSRIGIKVERSEAISLYHNELLHNFVGLQMQRAEELQLQRNDFIGNVTNVWDDGSSDSLIQHNYWDTLQGLDVDGDGYSELSYKSAPFFLSLIERRPSFQLLFGTVGISFVEQLYAGDAESWISDAAPSINGHFARGAAGQGIHWGMLIIWSALCAAGLYIMIKARRYEQ